MASERENLHAAIAALEAQRPLLGDAVVEAGLAPMRARYAVLAAETAPTPTAHQTLKQVTILFLDVVGSTSLSQVLDPEDTHAVMDGLLASCTALVKSHGGKVLQYAGDSLLAVFGADESREDDPELAVRTGLALLAEGRSVGAEVLHRHGHAGFDVRVGVHTGGVLLGGGVDAEGSIRGNAVNIAARMEQSAPPGGLRISHDTYRHVRGVFDLELQPPILVKGVDEPIQTYLVQRAKPRAFRMVTHGIEGVETRMIGRDKELEILREGFKRLYAEPALQMMVVVGEAGLGKSRLLYEFQDWAALRPEVFLNLQGRANPRTQFQPYGLLRDMLAWRLELSDGDSMQAAKVTVEAGITPLFVADEGADMAQAHAHILGHLLGLDFSDSPHVKGILDDPKQIRNRGFRTAAELLRRLSARADAPIVLGIEDLHWADDGSLDFFNYLIEINHDVPMLMLALTRPTLFERRADWMGVERICRRIDLTPLGELDGRTLADELLRKLPEIPTDLRELVTGRSEGNPFYMEELVRMLVDQGAIETGSDRWTLHTGKLLVTHIPATLTGVLQARLDGLPAAEKLSLQYASVIGMRFWDEALAALASEAVDALPSLVKRELVVTGSNPAVERMCERSFKHQTLHDVVYDTLLKRDRRELHARMAAWLTGLTDSRAGDFLGEIAGHYERAGDSANAAEYFARAAERARARFAHEAALGYVARALVLIGTAEDTVEYLLHWRLLDARERTLDMQGRRTEQKCDLDALQQLADALDRNQWRAEIALRRTSLAMSNADYHSQEGNARQAIELAAKSGDDELRLNAQRLLAAAQARRGESAAGKALAQQGLEEARARGMRRAEARFLSTLAAIAGWRNDYVAVLELTQQELSIARDLGNRLREAVALSNLGRAYLTLGELTRAQSYLEESLRLHRLTGNRAMEPLALANLSTLALWRGDNLQALTQAQTALSIAANVQARDYEAVALFQLGNSELALGREAAAARAFERCHAVAQSIDSAWQHDATAGLARVAQSTGDSDAAIACVASLLDHLDRGGGLEEAGRPRLILVTCYEVLACAADPRALSVLDRAHSDLEAAVRTIGDSDLQSGFLRNIPEHRKILSAWEASQIETPRHGDH